MIFRILQTSADLALDWGDPTQAAQGYLCVCDVPPVPPGATLDPDKLAIRQQVLDEIAYKGTSHQGIIIFRHQCSLSDI